MYLRPLILSNLLFISVLIVDAANINIQQSRRLNKSRVRPLTVQPTSAADDDQSPPSVKTVSNAAVAMSRMSGLNPPASMFNLFNQIFGAMTAQSNAIPNSSTFKDNNVPQVVAGIVTWQVMEFLRTYLAKSASTDHSKAVLKSLQGLPTIVQLIISATVILPIAIRTNSAVENLSMKVDSLGRREEELKQANEILNDATLLKLRNSAADALTEAHRVLANAREVADEESKKKIGDAIKSIVDAQKAQKLEAKL